MDVLFSECTVQVQSRALVLFLQQLNLSLAMSTVRDVALRFIDCIFQVNTYDELGIAPGWPVYRALMTAVPQAFPAAKKLKITLCTVINGWENYSEAEPAAFPGWVTDADPKLVTSGILDPLDTMYLTFRSPLMECQVVLSGILFDVVARDELVQGTGIMHPELDISKWDCFWRPLAGQGGKFGYWVRKDPPFPDYESGDEDC
jgi:hypothetical protein